MNATLLRQLIDHLEVFEKETGQHDLAAFITWMQGKDLPVPTAAPAREDHFSIDGQIAATLSVLQQHARHYVKTALKDSPLVGVNDFGFLAILFYREDSLRKTELINQGYNELSPGMEVVRRLLRHGLIEDFDDPDDRRARRVRLTEQGRTVFLGIIEEMEKASRIVTGNLDDREKIQLLNLLQKLQQFHDPIWKRDWGLSLNEILQKYLVNSFPDNSEE